MGNSVFSRFKPQTPIEFVLGFAALARATWVFIAVAFDRHSVLLQEDERQGIALGIAFLMAAVFIFAGNLLDNTILRFFGILMALVQTVSVMVLTIINGTVVATPITFLGNMVISALCVGLLYSFFVGDDE